MRQSKSDHSRFARALYWGAQALNAIAFLGLLYCIATRPSLASFMIEVVR